jgi:amidase
MDRRKFLRNTSLSGISITALGTASFAAGVNDKTLKVDDQKSASPNDDEFALKEATIDQLQKKMKSGELTSVQITEMYIKRIKQLDKELNSVIELNPDALLIAQNMDMDRKAGRIRSPLHGIPVLIKDNIDTKDQMMTTAGSLAMVGNKASKDAHIVQLLREGGAVILGKTNLSEWANYRSTRSASGWSSRGGQTRNPYILDRDPSGSSSGSAAAVSTNLCTVAVGTETDGSVISPSAYCGIVGLKPTVGLVSRSGIIPISKTQDTAGPMARTVRDCAMLLGVMAGADPADPVTSESASKGQPDYTKYLDSNALSGKRIGIEKSSMKGHEGMVALFNQAVDVLKAKGATVVEVDLLKATNELSAAELTVLSYEFKDGVNKYLSSANAKVKSLTDVIAYNRQQEKKVMPWFKQEKLESSQDKGDLNTKEYKDALAKSTSARKIIDDVMRINSLNAICAVSMGFPGIIDLINGDYDTGFYFPSPAAMAGYPHITVPMGTYKDLPAGFSFIAGAYKEPELLAMAYSFEQASHKRKIPTLTKTLPLS